MFFLFKFVYIILPQFFCYRSNYLLRGVQFLNIFERSAVSKQSDLFLTNSEFFSIFNTNTTVAPGASNVIKPIRCNNIKFKGRFDLSRKFYSHVLAKRAVFSQLCTLNCNSKKLSRCFFNYSYSIVYSLQYVLFMLFFLNKQDVTYCINSGFIFCNNYNVRNKYQVLQCGDYVNFLISVVFLKYLIFRQLRLAQKDKFRKNLHKHKLSKINNVSLLSFFFINNSIEFDVFSFGFFLLYYDFFLYSGLFVSKYFFRLYN